MVWNFRFEYSAGRDFAKLDKNAQTRLLRFLKERESRNPKEYAKALTGEFKGFWRIRIGDYRMIIQIDESVETASIYEVGHRKDIYRKP